MRKTSAGVQVVETSRTPSEPLGTTQFLLCPSPQIEWWLIYHHPSTTLRHDRTYRHLAEELAHLYVQGRVTDYEEGARFAVASVRRLHRRAAAFIKAVDAAR